ncbi:MAG TPA: DUF4251 domain-containing protein [Prolixibacteraceae bacterium]|nr:DUF4251 domain-containing protein [Prolixibacteraceae bacterium]
MKKIVFLFILALSSNFIFAASQDNSKLTRKERKELRKAELEEKYQHTKQLLQERNFVLESDFLQTRYGQRIPVSPTINFVAVEEGTGIIQVGSNYGMGPNGVGGVTAKGNITNYELQANDKKKTFNLRMTVMSSIGVYNLNFWINPQGQATARLTGMTAGNLTFDGDVVALQNSGVYEGHSL